MILIYIGDVTLRTYQFFVLTLGLNAVMIFLPQIAFRTDLEIDFNDGQDLAQFQVANQIGLVVVRLSIVPWRQKTIGQDHRTKYYISNHQPNHYNIYENYQEWDHSESIEDADTHLSGQFFLDQEKGGHEEK